MRASRRLILLGGGGGGAAPFSPSDISGMTLWLKADALTLSDTDPVTTWTDSALVGDATQATAGNKPTFRTNVVNGKPVVRFDGTDDFMDLSSRLYRTIFAVIKYNLASFSEYDGVLGYTGAHILNGNDATTRMSKGTVPGTSAWRNGVSKAFVTDGHDMSPINEFFIISFILGSDVTQAAWVGKTDGIGRAWTGDIAEIIAYNTALADADRDNVETHLGDKYGITVS